MEQLFQKKDDDFSLVVSEYLENLTSESDPLLGLEELESSCNNNPEVLAQNTVLALYLAADSYEQSLSLGVEFGTSVLGQNPHLGRERDMDLRRGLYSFALTNLSKPVRPVAKGPPRFSPSELPPLPPRSP